MMMTSTTLLWSILSSLSTAQKQMEELLQLEDLDNVTRESLTMEVIFLKNVCRRVKDIEGWSSHRMKQNA
jgi:hypothetical protein